MTASPPSRSRVPPSAIVATLAARAPDATPEARAALAAAVEIGATEEHWGRMMLVLRRDSSRELLAAWMVAAALITDNRRLARVALRETKPLGGRRRLDDEADGEYMARLMARPYQSESAAARAILIEREQEETPQAIARLRRALARHRRQGGRDEN